MSRYATALLLILGTMLLEATPINTTRQQQGPRSALLELNSAQATVDPVTAWNMVCANWEFPPAPAASDRDTFMSQWQSVQNHALTFNEAIAGITADMNSILWSFLPPPDGDDSFNFVINNWQ